ncbi:hypothetical protein SAMN04487830_1442 [Pseudobutyrivibrio sp. OR37]|uniref:hypothetical protein n=1 Tax=Pseudobutyrivibrio sp. OR37 TaxID=1798186 RepID=UPI0008E0B5F9|nr:hypothetical protein [Pseudobutyrivibrio sp. OR37]SFI33188.1 hypothetical protein SAMN04487830_1442 [Pseudobutyrivibrio sp. OR37]
MYSMILKYSDKVDLNRLPDPEALFTGKGIDEGPENVDIRPLIYIVRNKQVMLHGSRLLNKKRAA